MFFAGRLPSPPWETRRPRRRDGQADRPRRTSATTGDRFRFSTLQSRYSTFVDLWDRGLRAREEGRPGPFAQPRPVARREAEGGRPEDRVLHVTTFKDPLKEMDKLRELYDSLAEARREVGEEPSRSTSSPT